MEDRLLFVISPPRAGSTLLQRMLGSHSQVQTHPEPHLITPLAYLGYYDLVDRAPYDHINAAEAMRAFVSHLPSGEADYLDALRAYTDTMYGRMLRKDDRRYFLDKTPAYALVLPFLRKLYPRAHYVVLTRHPLAVMSSYANSFFSGDWQQAQAFNPIVNRYVPAISAFLAEPPRHTLHVQYETLVSDPQRELQRLFAFLGLEDEPDAVHYGKHFDPQAGPGDPLTVHRHGRPVDTGLNKWVEELAEDPEKLQLAEDIVSRLVPDDVMRWGFDKGTLLDPVSRVERPAPVRHSRPRLNGYLLQRRILLALKKDIRNRPHGRLLEKVRYYCNVLLRE